MRSPVCPEPAWADESLEPEAAHPALEESSAHGRLAFRPRAAVPEPGRTGFVEFTGDDGGQLGIAYVPTRVGEGRTRLVVVLHGAGGTARHGLDLLIQASEDENLLLLAPKSRSGTWDFIAHSYGPDVLLLDRLLGEVAATYRIRGLSIGGFSDGASYALSLGVANGDIFDSVVAFVPGFMAPLLEHGRPRLFVAHGSADPVLPVDRCSRRLVPRLQRSGYEVTYREFPGGHTVPPEVAAEAARWLSAADEAP